MAASLTGGAASSFTSGLERIPFRWNRNSLYVSLRHRIFCGEPVSTSPENALVEIGNVEEGGSRCFITTYQPDYIHCPCASFRCCRSLSSVELVAELIRWLVVQPTTLGAIQSCASAANLPAATAIQPVLSVQPAAYGAVSPRPCVDQAPEAFATLAAGARLWAARQTRVTRLAL